MRNVSRSVPFRSLLKNVFLFSDRPRFNEPEVSTPERPTISYFSENLKTLGKMFQESSENLKILSEVLKKDEKFDDPKKVEIQRRTVQNNFDSIRYTAPLLVNLTKLKLPLGKPEALVKLAE